MVVDVLRPRARLARRLFEALFAALLCTGVACATEPPERELTVSCDEQVASSQVAAETRRSALKVGGLVLFGMEQGREFDTARPSVVTAHVIVPPGRDTYRLSVTESDRPYLGLLYGGEFERSLREAARSVSFESCSNLDETVYVGGVIVDQPRCVTLEVREESGKRATAQVRLGAVRCVDA